MSDDKPENQIQSTAQIVSAALDKVPVYQDLAHPALSEIGAGLGGALKMVMLPLKLIGYQADHWQAVFVASLERKTARIPPERVVSPNPTIAGPVLQRLGYTVHEEPLREMFTTLLATAMDSETAGDAHPSFAEIIGQLTPAEARMLQVLKSAPRMPTVTVRLNMAESRGYYDVLDQFSLLGVAAGLKDHSEARESITNLQRLGLLELASELQLTRENAYDSLESHPDVVAVMSRTFELPTGPATTEVVRGYIALTPLGKRFGRACISDDPGTTEAAVE